MRVVEIDAMDDLGLRGSPMMLGSGIGRLMLSTSVRHGQRHAKLCKLIHNPHDVQRSKVTATTMTECRRAEPARD